MWFLPVALTCRKHVSIQKHVLVCRLFFCHYAASDGDGRIGKYEGEMGHIVKELCSETLPSTCGLNSNSCAGWGNFKCSTDGSSVWGIKGALQSNGADVEDSQKLRKPSQGCWYPGQVCNHVLPECNSIRLPINRTCLTLWRNEIFKLVRVSWFSRIWYKNSKNLSVLWSRTKLY